MRARRRLRRSRRGELAAFDVVLFMPLLIIAFLFLSEALTVRPSLNQEATNGSRYAYAGLNTLLTATVPFAQTINSTGQTITVQDWSVEQLMLWDVYLVSCHSTTQATLDRGGWMGWQINATAASIARGATQGGSPTAFNQYYLAFNGTAPATSWCANAPVPVHVEYGSPPLGGTTDVYTSNDVLLPPALPGEGSVLVVMGVWQQA